MPRQKNFDEGQALELMTNLFWEKGYSETSLDDLKRVTGLHKTSLYNTFGNKEEIFLKTVERYVNLPKNPKETELKGLSFLNNFFSRLIAEAVSGKGFRGCLIMNSMLELQGGVGDKKGDEIKKHWNSILNQLVAALKSAKSLGELKPSTQIGPLSEWLMSQAFLIRQMSRISNEKTLFIEIQKNIFNKLRQESKKRM